MELLRASGVETRADIRHDGLNEPCSECHDLVDVSAGGPIQPLGGTGRRPEGLPSPTERDFVHGTPRNAYGIGERTNGVLERLHEDV
jgi:hypothetical protein